MKKKVLVLGQTGMLGSMVYHYLNNQSPHQITATSRRRNRKPNVLYFETTQFLKNNSRFSFLQKFDYLINCIGVTKPLCKDNDPEGVYQAIATNAFFPHQLSRYCLSSKVTLIQIITDCVFSGKKGPYKEDDLHDPQDVYGKTKSLGEPTNKNILNVRTSFIGPEIYKKIGLFEWFLEQPKRTHLNGFDHHKWNGATTLQCAQLFKKLIDSPKLTKKLISANPTHHYLVNQTVTKYELLNILNSAFKRNCVIKKVNDIGDPIDRSLSTNFSILSNKKRLPMETAIKNLAQYLSKNQISTSL